MKNKKSQKQVLIDAIINKGFPDFSFAIKMEKAGFATFPKDGRKVYSDWEWKREVLETLNEPKLQDIYDRLKLKEKDNGYLVRTIWEAEF